ncbi:MAG: DUF433 domain-containing protein [Thermoguttaceae bacterium]
MEPILEKAHIECTPGVCGGKPRIAGRRIRVQDIFVLHELKGLTPDGILQAYPDITLADVHAALAYYWDHREEIQRQMRADEEFVESLRAKSGPGLIEQIEGQETPDRASLPSG